MTQDEIIELARHIASTFGTRMCDENGDTHGEELYAMGLDDIVDTIKLVASAATAKEREACARLSTEAMGGPHLFGTHQEWLMHKHGVVAYHNLIRARGEA